MLFAKQSNIAGVPVNINLQLDTAKNNLGKEPWSRNYLDQVGPGGHVRLDLLRWEDTLDYGYFHFPGGVTDCERGKRASWQEAAGG